jgi:hypothetical protein
MPRVVSLTDLVPDPRYDGVPWTQAEVQEATAPDGAWLTVDTLALVTLDTDPSAPMARSVTTAQAQLTTGWYRLVFLDAGGNASEPSDVVRSSIDSDMPPSPDDVWDASPLLREKFPRPAVDPAATGDLRRITYQAIALVQSVTWRLIDQTLGCPAPPDEGQCELVPNELAPVALQAIARMAERIKVTTDPAFAEQIATGRRLRGFNAGPYSESYFAPGEFARRGATQGRPPMDTDDALDSALWALATEDARDYFVWRATGVAPPTGVATAFDYRRQSLGYGSGTIGWPGGFGHGGPDGY